MASKSCLLALRRLRVSFRDQNPRIGFSILTVKPQWDRRTEALARGAMTSEQTRESKMDAAAALVDRTKSNSLRSDATMAYGHADGMRPGISSSACSLPSRTPFADSQGTAERVWEDFGHFPFRQVKTTR